MFAQMIGIVIALCCLLAILSAILPDKMSPPLSLLLSMLVLLAVLSPFTGDRLTLPQVYGAEVEQAEKQGESRLQETMIKLTRTGIEQQVIQLARERTGLEADAAVELEWQNGMVRVVTITVVTGQKNRPLEQELKGLYGAELVIVN